ncbi:hypothetical protein G6F31_017738 [Rhizopus arrhizus]|nr:hypothetical protein G6F31_017738 [Rhizopus arrhizus]
MQDEIGHPQQAEHFERLGQQHAVDLVRGIGQFLHADHIGQRRLLHRRHELAQHAGQHVVERLRQDHAPHCLHVRQAQRAAGFLLAGGQRLDAGADDLGQVRAFVADQRHHHRRGARDGAANDERLEEIRPKDEHQKRQAAHQVDHCRGRPEEDAVGADAAQRQQHAAGKRQGQADRGQAQGGDQAAHRSVRVLPDQQQQPVVFQDVPHVSAPPADGNVGARAPRPP